MASQPPLASASRWTTAADRVAVVVNGNAKQVTDELVEILDQIVQSGDLFVSRSLEEGREIARTEFERRLRLGLGEPRIRDWTYHPLMWRRLAEAETGEALAKDTA